MLSKFLTLCAITTLASTAAAQVALVTPNGGEVFFGQDHAQIVFIDLQFQPSATYDVDYSTDFGATWIPLHTGLFALGGLVVYNWRVPDIATSQGRIRVTMYTSGGFFDSEDQGDLPFTIIPSYVDYGSGTPVQGTEPTLEFSRLPKAGQDVRLQVRDAQPNIPAFLLVGSQMANQPYAGLTLLNNRDLMQVQASVDAQGEIDRLLEIPTAMVGLTLHAQVVVQSTPNLSSTHGVAFTVLP